ncbi:DNA adenine methylase [Paractinoplanes ferrugineus]|uniref:Site-specific DNA-methyltransferase n=1 Tax=Paractinoplanes ferrugineus TaxID=113564 RepID=A0A919MDD0_9ACTN|nr:DNA adenine methylase [Actinoplanes ferrugineus]GIE11628.1 site-specific DNA-methyltransferase [Actinoplanes ferrugineus]
MPVRYMGTKRYLAADVRAAIESVQPAGPVVDLFSGIGAVASALSPDHHVITNDALSFTTVLARARFGPGRRSEAADLLPRICARYRERENELRAAYGTELAAESAALKGSWEKLARFMLEHPHVGTDADTMSLAKSHAGSETSDRYSLTTLYFAAGYFSVRQAIQIDSLRCAIDQEAIRKADWDWMTASWLSSTASVMNAPGHTAQYLRVSGDLSQTRVRRAWSRDIWNVFVDRVAALVQEGTPDWRAGNVACSFDALDFISSDALKGAGVVYADPPYTKDHYSRYYHVYETLYRYDYPASVGAGRYRDDRFVTDFSVKSRVEEAFEALASGVKSRGLPLVLSYPDNGLLVLAGVNLFGLLASKFDSVVLRSHAHSHSTLGAAGGKQKKKAVENIYVCS